MDPTIRGCTPLNELPPGQLGQASRAALALIEPDGRIAWASEVLGRLLHTAPDALSGRAFGELCAPESLRTLDSEMSRLAATDGPFPVTLVGPDSTPVHMACTSAPGCAGRRLLLGFPQEALPQSALETASLEAPPVVDSVAEAARRAAEIRLQAVLDNAPMAIWTWENWKVTHFSRFWSRIAGTPAPEEGEPAHWVDVLVPEDRECAIREFHAAVRAGRPYEGEGRIQRQDGTFVHVWTRAIPVHDLKSGQLFYQGYTVDITRRSELEEQLRQAQKMEAVGRLAGGIAQDFNNLIMAITGYLQLMQAKVGSGHPLHHHLQQVTRAADQAGTLTRQLMAVSGRQLLDRRPMPAPDEAVGCGECQPPEGPRDGMETVLARPGSGAIDPDAPSR